MINSPGSDLQRSIHTKQMRSGPVYSRKNYSRRKSTSLHPQGPTVKPGFDVVRNDRKVLEAVEQCRQVALKHQATLRALPK
jgi:hypothetical protein